MTIIDPDTILKMDRFPARMQTGAAVALLRSHDRSNPGHYGDRKPLPQALRTFLEHVRSRTLPDLPAVPRHPADAARTVLGADQRDGGELTAVELAWLNRLPVDAADVTFDDAAQLASLARSVRVQHTASRRLIESIWGPVNDLHTERGATARLAEINRTSLATSDRARAAVASCFADRYPEDRHRPTDAANASARTALANEHIDRWTKYEAARLDRDRARAQRDLDDVRTRQAERAETTRDHLSPAASS